MDSACCFSGRKDWRERLGQLVERVMRRYGPSRVTRCDTVPPRGLWRRRRHISHELRADQPAVLREEVVGRSVCVSRAARRMGTSYLDRQDKNAGGRSSICWSWSPFSLETSSGISACHGCWDTCYFSRLPSLMVYAFGYYDERKSINLIFTNLISLPPPHTNQPTLFWWWRLISLSLM